MLNNGNIISIISKDKCDSGDFFNTVSGSRKSNIIFVEDKMKSIPHFILVGDSAYRLEKDDVSKTAIGVFNNQGVGSFLDSLFNDVKSNLEASTV